MGKSIRWYVWGFSESPGECFQKGFLMSIIRVFVRWSLVHWRSIDSPYEKFSLKYIFIFTYKYVLLCILGVISSMVLYYFFNIHTVLLSSSPVALTPHHTMFSLQQTSVNKTSNWKCRIVKPSLNWYIYNTIPNSFI